MYEEPKSGAMKYIVGIVLIALVIIGVSLLSRNKKSEKKADKEVSGVTSNMPTIDSPDTKETVVIPAENAKEIIYTDANGFTPDNISIKIGDTVRFVNKSTSRMWVAVNEHPTHTKYDGTTLKEHCVNGASTVFDQCSAGAEYSFTFTKAGSWEYHNHARSSMGGKITVK